VRQKAAVCRWDGGRGGRGGGGVSPYEVSMRACSGRDHIEDHSLAPNPTEGRTSDMLLISVATSQQSHNETGPQNLQQFQNIPGMHCQGSREHTTTPPPGPALAWLDTLAPRLFHTVGVGFSAPKTYVIFPQPPSLRLHRTRDCRHCPPPSSSGMALWWTGWTASWPNPALAAGCASTSPAWTRSLVGARGADAPLPPFGKVREGGGDWRGFPTSPGGWTRAVLSWPWGRNWGVLTTRLCKGEKLAGGLQILGHYGGGGLG